MIKLENTQNFHKIEEILWQDAKNDLTKVNSELAQIIDEINPGKDLSFLRISYAFGDHILETGKLSLLELFVKNKITVKEPIKQKFLQYLNYATIPLGICLNKSCEVFAESYDRIIPLVVLTPGLPIGIYEAMDSIFGAENFPLWSARAGARTTFMLPKISNNVNHNRLKKELGIGTIAPKGMFEQIDTFAAIANSSQKNRKEWSCDILFFTDKWFQKIHDTSSGWVKFREYLLKEYWKNSNAFVGKNLSFVWQQLSSAINRKRLKPNVYVTDTIRHLLNISYSLLPGFAPLCDDEMLAPTKLLKKTYVEIYKIEHAPTIMAPAILQSSSAVYYSLGCPTLLEGFPDMFNSFNTIEYLQEIKYLIKNLIEYCSLQITDFKNFESFIKNISFSYFHKIKDDDTNDIETLLSEDPNFQETQKFVKNKKPCTSSPFFNGCIRIKTS